MKLIGMLDSPYVRRVAISLQLLDLPFEHQSLSVFRTFDEFSRTNPVVKAPTLVCDDGTARGCLFGIHAELLEHAREHLLMGAGFVEILAPLLLQVLVHRGLDRGGVDLDAAALGLECLQQQFMDLRLVDVAGTCHG